MCFEYRPVKEVIFKFGIDPMPLQNWNLAINQFMI
jgi:hypothetical protein